MKIQIKKVSPRLPEVHEVDFGSTEPIDDVSRIKRYAPRIFGSGQLAAGLCEDMRGYVRNKNSPAAKRRLSA